MRANGWNDDLDRELVERFRRGDVAAFDELYQRLRRLTYTVILHATNRETARDLQQDVWERVIRNIHAWQPTSSFRAWVMTILHNRLTDQYRKRAEVLGKAKDEDGDEDEPIDDRPAAQRDPLLATVLGRCIGHLEEEQRHVFWMHADRMTFVEIGEAMGAPAGTTNRRWQLALAHLRRCLGKHGIGDAS